MSNVIPLTVPGRRQTLPARHRALIDCFARHRRISEDVFWLKENAELLNILECTGADLPEAALDPHLAFYDRMEDRLGFFPQYYRFLLSICLDLEDLGMPGQKGEALSYWAARQGLADAEMSDLQRAEARRLMLRRGIDPLPDDAGLTGRLHAFMDRTDTFAMPNRKAAYELTHIVFYLSEYGRRDPGLSPAALRSLEYAGLLAFLDLNADLLAEICIALRYAGRTPSAVWEGWISRHIRAAELVETPGGDTRDMYHEYFVGNWALAVAGQPAFAAQVPDGRTSFFCGDGTPGPLRQISQAIFALGDNRCGDWTAMRPHVEAALDEDGAGILAAAEASSDRFDSFFAGFSRTGLCGVTL